MNNLCKIYQNLANSKGKKVYADTIAVSGSTLKGHSERSNTYRKIKSNDWDYVFIQGFSRELSYDTTRIELETLPYARILIDSIRSSNPCARIYYYMTWGYEAGYVDSIPGDTYEAMQERIKTGYMFLSRNTGNIPVVPVGMVWKDLKVFNPTLDLYAPDRAHPSIYGTYAAACAFYTAVYKDSPCDGVCPKKIDDSNADEIQTVASNYVLTYFPFYNLDAAYKMPDDVVPPKMAFDVKEKWLSVTVSNKSTPAKKYYWDFGDGKTSTKRNPKHYYSSPGKYTITLNVKSECYWFTHKKTVKVSDKVKHANSPQKQKAN